eukprot:CAMPEP_0202762520 /NCGR_PEP_ID=MMETSP1388-20130828/20970_1 /ASSEMBLY_ACC=CAM_ASM_000864 /TAXON_ID=37098 /ORGANISM="Isochrysis sp, Strain CCMP1244" /LENGTH=116 /DNA_ID=CAMNT_0049430737 /DNA_START=81 /DNA_END=431 /DNA_ORIENTATION=-
MPLKVGASMPLTAEASSHHRDSVGCVLSACFGQQCRPASRRATHCPSGSLHVERACVPGGMRWMSCHATLAVERDTYVTNLVLEQAFTLLSPRLPPRVVYPRLELHSSTNYARPST